MTDDDDQTENQPDSDEVTTSSRPSSPAGDESVHVSHRVPADVKDRAKENTVRGELSERVREIYEQAANPSGLTDRDDINAEMRRLRNERDEKNLELRQTRDRLNAEIDTIDTKLARLEERRENAKSKADRFDGRIDALAGRVRRGERIFEGFPDVREAARLIDEPESFVIRKVRDRVPEADEDLFSEGDWNGRAGPK